MLAITLVSPDPAALAEAAAAVREALAVSSETVLGEGALDLLADGPPVETHQAVKAAVGDRPVDFAVQPVTNRRKRLLIADMDSTIINVECLDELADFAGVKDKVSEITERAMRGELAFEGALRERVGMLKGLSVDALQACYDDRVKLNPGARTLVRTMAAHGAAAPWSRAASPSSPHGSPKRRAST
jgi:phosphoserine phosphatase